MWGWKSETAKVEVGEATQRDSSELGAASVIDLPSIRQHLVCVKNKHCLR